METQSKTGTAAGLCASCLGVDLDEAQKLVEKNVKVFRETGAASLEDAAFAAKRLYKRGKFAVEEGVDETVRVMRRHPVGTAAAFLATGIALGFLLPRVVKTNGDSEA